jgi:hypothetical protein
MAKMREAIPVPEKSHGALSSNGETSNVSDNDTSVATDATPRTYCALTERPTNFTDIFAPARRPFVEAAATYKALRHRPANFNRMVLLVAPRRHLTEQPVPTYRALVERPTDFTEIMALPKITTIPEIVATPQELESVSNQGTDQTESCGKPLSEPRAGFASRQTVFTPPHQPTVVARRPPQRAD